jgi:hypothetical protein
MAMKSSFKLTLVAATACFLGMAATVQSVAQAGSTARPDPSSLYQQQHYSVYQGPDGTYGGPADFIRSVEGIPCGIECTRRRSHASSRFSF